VLEGLIVAMPILAMIACTKVYPSQSKRDPTPTRALDGVTLEIAGGESVGVVGESGSGKTTLSRLLLGLTDPTSGTVSFDGKSLSNLTRSDQRVYRRSVSAVFQNPFGSLDPRMRVRDLVTEQMRIERDGDRLARRRRATELLELVGLTAEMLASWPHQLSGGQRQRVAIARALSRNPRLVVLDECTSALDVSARAQIVNLLLGLQQDLGLSFVFVAHDLATVQHMCERVVVMRHGVIVEEGATEQVFESPQHPYTVELIRASYLQDVGDSVAAKK
jgi:peptide/nickel transport system ATP-binding protein